MNLRGQHGYAMVALLVGMSIMAILMTAAMPTWSQAARREKEAELVFRGQQYARAIGLFQRKSGPGVLPPSVDALVQQKFLRKKYKDPITGQDFDLLTTAQQSPGSTSPTGSPGPGQRGSGPSANQGGLVSATPQQGGGAVAGGIAGVASKSKAESLRIYNGRTHYNEWQFLYVAQTQAPGTGSGPNTGRGGPARGGANQTPPGGGFNDPGGRNGRRGQPPQGGGSGLPPRPGGRL